MQLPWLGDAMLNVRRCSPPATQAGLARTLGAQAPTLLRLIESPPAGAVPLALQVRPDVPQPSHAAMRDAAMRDVR
jgi:hypothetical protein